jgi:phosphotransferase system HPr (HPr) family protein
MKDFLHTVNNPNGMHARPAGLFVEKTQQCKSVITVKRDEQSADGKKLFALMKLCIKYGQTILITAEGEDEDEAIQTVREFLTANV